MTEDNNSLNKKFRTAKEKFKNKYGDHIAIHKIMDKYVDLTSNKRSDFTYKYFLKNKNLEKAESYFNKMKYSFKNKLNDVKSIENINSYSMEERIMGAIYFGYTLNIAFNKGKYYNTLKAENIKLSRSSYVNYLSSEPSQVIYGELFNSNGKLELNIISVLNSKIKEIITLL
jgi:hypothetical protein